MKVYVSRVAVKDNSGKSQINLLLLYRYDWNWSLAQGHDDKKNHGIIGNAESEVYPNTLKMGIYNMLKYESTEYIYRLLM